MGGTKNEKCKSYLPVTVIPFGVALLVLLRSHRRVYGELLLLQLTYVQPLCSVPTYHSSHSAIAAADNTVAKLPQTGIE